MNNNNKQLMEDVFNCNNIQEVLNTNNKNNCRKIVESQGVTKEDYHQKFQIPEPWNGDIEHSHFLFIGFNPSFDPDEFYPTPDWSLADKLSYFGKRFENKNWDKIHKKEYTKTPYWRNINKWVAMVKYLETNAKIENNWFEDCIKQYKEKKDYNLKDVCLTEAIHCKDKKAADALPCFDCCKKYLSSIINIFVNNDVPKNEKKYIFIVIGDSKQKIDIKNETYRIVESIVRGTNITLKVMPHPSNANSDEKIAGLLLK